MVLSIRQHQLAFKYFKKHFWKGEYSVKSFLEKCFISLFLSPAEGGVGAGATFFFIGGGGECFAGGEEFFQQLFQ